MLTATQAEIAAFVTNGGIICRDCATARFGELGVAAIEEGIAEFLPQDVSPLIRYELDGILRENAAQYANEIVGPDPPHAGAGVYLTDEQLNENEEFWRRWDDEFERANNAYCDSCGQDIS